MSVLPCPRGLARDGRRLWRELTADYGYRADELVLLERLCRCADELAELDGVCAEEPMFVKGGHGSVHEHPARGARRQVARLASDLVRRLGLDDAVGGQAQVWRAASGKRDRRSHRRVA